MYEGDHHIGIGGDDPLRPWSFGSRGSGVRECIHMLDRQEDGFRDEHGGRLTYHYGMANKDELTIVGIPASGNIFQMSQRFAGMEYQLRFRNGEFNYIVYSSEGNGRVGAAASSGLVVMRGTKVISDRSCSRYADLTMPDDALAVPEDTDLYSAM